MAIYKIYEVAGVTGLARAIERRFVLSKPPWRRSGRSQGWKMRSLKRYIDRHEMRQDDNPHVSAFTRDKAFYKPGERAKMGAIRSYRSGH